MKPGMSDKLLYDYECVGKKECRRFRHHFERKGKIPGCEFYIGYGYCTSEKFGRKIMKKTKIGILGGAFDPIHNGHLFLAENLKHQLKLDHILFIPNGISPHKRSLRASPKDRLTMCKLAVDGNFWVSAMETIRKEPCYTIDTIRALKEEYRNSILYFLMGHGNIKEIKTWRNWKDLLQEIQFVAEFRAGQKIIHTDKSIEKMIKYVETPSIDISSTLIREKIRRNQPFRYLVPDPVYEYIQSYRLYKGSK